MIENIMIKDKNIKGSKNSLSKVRYKINFNENAESKQQEKVNSALHIIIEEKQGIFSPNKISNGLSLLTYMNIINSSKYKVYYKYSFVFAAEIILL